MPSIAGVDSYKSGWVIVSEDRHHELSINLVSDFQDVLNLNFDVVVIDIPIGLLDKGVRLADQEARNLLKNRACCVFTAPIRPLLTCNDYCAASAHRKHVEGKGITKQLWGIMRKICQVDSLMTRELQATVKEGHPEVTFAVMNNGTPISIPKRKVSGRVLRIKLLEKYFPEISGALANHPASIQSDVIDAFAMLWTAQRVRNDMAFAFPQTSPPDTRGLQMQIWA